MANRLLNIDMKKNNIVTDDDDWDTEPEYNTNNIDNSKQTQKSTIPVRASEIGRDLLQNQAPVDKTPHTPPPQSRVQHAPTTYTPPGVVVSKKPAANPSVKPAAPVPTQTSAPVKTGGVSSAASKFSQPAPAAPVKAAAPPPVKSAPPPVKATPPQQAAPIKATPPPVAAPVKKPPPPPKRVEPVYEEPVYEEPAYEEPAYEEPAYEEPVQEQYYDDQQQYDQQQYDQQQYDDQQQSYDQQGYDDQQQQGYDLSAYPQAEALYDYVAQQEGDLTFYTGDIIYIYDTSDESGWYTGECNGYSGSFPSNFVKLL